jgi:cytosine/uracil/thiamine/allantoin permease
MIGFWATLSLNIPDFTRFGAGQREQMLGQTLGLPTTMIAFSAMGVVITSSASQAILQGRRSEKLWDPVFISGAAHLRHAAARPRRAADRLGGVRLLVAVVALLGVASRPSR